VQSSSQIVITKKTNTQFFYRPDADNASEVTTLWRHRLLLLLLFVSPNQHVAALKSNDSCYKMNQIHYRRVVLRTPLTEHKTLILVRISATGALGWICAWLRHW